VQTIPTNEMETAEIAVAFNLVIFFSSTRYATTTSKTEIVDVRAAIARSKKNKIAKKYPPAICSKTNGSVIKTKPGPSPGFTLKAKTAGKIATPARMAIRVSVKETDIAVFPRLSDF